MNRADQRAFDDWNRRFFEAERAKQEEADAKAEAKWKRDDERKFGARRRRAEKSAMLEALKL